MKSIVIALTIAVLAGALVVAEGTTATLAQPKPNQIEKLIRDGWEVTGYVAAFENRTLILFKHKEHHYLVQCSILIDVTIVRALRVPSAMKLFGRWNWWLPGRIARVLRVQPSPLGEHRPILRPAGK